MNSVSAVIAKLGNLVVSGLTGLTLLIFAFATYENVHLQPVARRATDGWAKEHSIIATAHLHPPQNDQPFDAEWRKEVHLTVSHDWFSFHGAPQLVSRGNKFLFGEQHFFAAKAGENGDVNLVASVDPGKTWHIAKTGLEAHSYSLLDTSSGSAILSVSSRHVKNEKVRLCSLFALGVCCVWVFGVSYHLPPYPPPPFLTNRFPATQLRNRPGISFNRHIQLR